MEHRQDELRESYSTPRYQPPPSASPMEERDQVESDYPPPYHNALHLPAAINMDDSNFLSESLNDHDPVGDIMSKAGYFPQTKSVDRTLSTRDERQRKMVSQYRRRD